MLQGNTENSAADIPATGGSQRIPACGNSEQLARLQQVSTSSVSRDNSQQQSATRNSRQNISGREFGNVEGMTQAHQTERTTFEVEIAEPVSASADTSQQSAGSNLPQQPQCATPAALPASGGGLEAGVEPLRADDSADRSGTTPTISGTGYLIWLPDGRLSGAVTPESLCSWTVSIRLRESLYRTILPGAVALEL